MTTSPMVGALADAFTGRLLTPASDGYDEARQVYNALVQRRPALIAQCRSAADAAAAVRYAREAGLPLTVRGGGHNVAGRAVADGAVMVDLSPLREVRVDPGRRTARVGGGATWADVNAAAAEHGLAVTGGQVSTTGVGGYTLGGGLGWLMSLYGLAADNVVAVELVTADGVVREVTAEGEPDLHWALRGGGGNFGVATAFEFQLHPLAQITGGIVAHPFEAARDVLRWWRDFSSTVPDELTVICVLAHAPDGSGAKIAGLAACHAGDPEQAARDLEPLLAFGSPVLTQVGPMPYPAINAMLDDAYPAGACNYWKSSFTSGLEDELLDAAVEQFAATPSPMNAILFEHFHGEVTRIPVHAAAVPHREPGYNLLLPSIWTDPTTTDANIAWTRETYERLASWFRPARWLNYLGDDETPEAVRQAYGPNYERLRQVKRRFDPDNVFRGNHNIEPAEAG